MGIVVFKAQDILQLRLSKFGGLFNLRRIDGKERLIMYKGFIRFSGIAALCTGLFLSAGFTSLCENYSIEKQEINTEKGQWRIDKVQEYGCTDNDMRPDYCETEYSYQRDGKVRTEIKTYYDTDGVPYSEDMEKTFFCCDYTEYMGGETLYKEITGENGTIYEEAWYSGDKVDYKNIYAGFDKGYVPYSDGESYHESYGYSMGLTAIEKIVCIHEYADGNAKRWDIIFESDENNNPIKQTKYDFDTKAETPLSEAVYDEKNNLIKNLTYDNGAFSSHTEYEYDENSNCTKISNYDRDGVISSYTEYKYDDNSNLVEKTLYESGKNPVTEKFKYEYKYADHGGLLSKTTYASNDTSEEYVLVGYLVNEWKFYPDENAEYLKQYGLSGYYMPDFYRDMSNSPMIIEGKDSSWNNLEYKYMKRWESYPQDVVPDQSYWYENGIKQGTYYDTKGVLGTDPKTGVVSNRGREICDNNILDANGKGSWFWLDACYDGAKAVRKEVWIPYVYQNEDEWDDETIRKIAEESDPGMADCVYETIKNKSGKWVRYDIDGKMMKGWVKIEGELAAEYPNQNGNTYYYDTRTGLMAKGHITIDGKEYYFDEITGALQDNKETVNKSL